MKTKKQIRQYKTNWEKEWGKKNPEKKKARWKKYLLKHPDYWKKYYERRRKEPDFRKRMNKWGKNSRDRRRDLCIKHYGGKCACCGETYKEFLGIDHIKGNGNKHRKEIAKQYNNIYSFLVRNNYPKGYRILCHNCNMSLGFYGYCPHKKRIS